MCSIPRFRVNTEPGLWLGILLSLERSWSVRVSFCQDRKAHEDDDNDCVKTFSKDKSYVYLPTQEPPANALPSSRPRFRAPKTSQSLNSLRTQNSGWNQHDSPTDRRFLRSTSRFSDSSGLSDTAQTSSSQLPFRSQGQPSHSREQLRRHQKDKGHATMMNTAEPSTTQQIQQMQALRVLLVHASALLPAAEWLQSVSHTSRTWRHLVHALVLADQTALFTSDLCVKHAIPRRSEKPERLRVVLDKCVARFPRIQVVRELPMATSAQLSRFHTELHVDTITRLGTKIETSMDALDKLRIVDTQSDGAALLSPRSQAANAAKKPHQTTKAMSKHEYYAQFEYIDMDDDTVMMRHTLDASMTAAGGVCHAIDRVLLSEKSKNQPRNAFCVVRPPGHHAEPQRAMGFCFFNNVGVGAFHALDAHSLTRVAIIDFDVHHGNGTQKRVESEPQILYVSLHQAPLYPGTGLSHETGQHNNIVNVPLKARTDSKTYRKLFLDKVWPRVVEFQPQLLLVSAGFDAHTHDPLADIRLQSEDYYWITREITKMAWRFCDGKVVSVLEGGYHFKALGESAEQHVLALVHGSVALH